MYWLMRRAHTRTCISIAILLAWCACAFALDPSLDVSQYAHTSWKVRDGFVRGEIESIAQTPDGYLWLGTEFGLIRFDGVRAVPWQPPGNQHLPPGSVYSLLVSRNGTVWIGTSKGLASWKDGKVTRYPELEEQFIFAVLEDRDGTIWVAAGGMPTAGRICAIRNGSLECFGGDGQLGPGVFALHEDRNGNLWAGVVDGLWRWKPGPPKFFSLPGAPQGILALADDSDGALLVGWRGGIFRFVDGKAEPYLLPGFSGHFLAEKMFRDGNDSLWLGTTGLGLVHVHQGRTDVFSKADGLSGDRAYAIFKDREGNVWVSTTEGLDRFREQAVVTLTAKQGLQTAVVGSILSDKNGSVWLATLEGLERWDHGRITIPSTGGSKRDGKLNGSNPNSLFLDGRGRIWVSTLREIGYLENGRFISIKGVPGGWKLSITQDIAENVWVVSEEFGLSRISPKNDVLQIPWSSLGHKDNASVLAADHERGGLWIGFFRGGIAYFSDGQILAAYTPADGLGTGRISDFQFDDDGTLWVSTAGGLSRLKNNHVATLTSKNGLPCDAVHWTIEDNDHSWWLYMACGLVRIDRSALNDWAAAIDNGQNTTPAIHVTVFDSLDGVKSLSSPSFWDPQVAKTPDGKLWFLPMDGVSVIDPHHLPINKLPPPVHVEEIIADGKTYDAASPGTQGLRLPPRVHNLEIHYTALSLVAPEKVRFRIKLEGVDPDWRELNDRHENYTNLGPGHYRFRVLACNNSGVWNEEGAALQFVIPPAWYQTNWFRALCVAAFLAVLYGLYRVRVGQLRAQEEKFREAIESIPAMAFVAQPDGNRTFVNKGWVDYTGLTVEQAAGSGWQEAVHPEDRKRVVAKWESALASGEPMDYEARFRRAADGQYRWFVVRVVPLRDKRGKIVKWSGTATDIEDRKRAEQLQSDIAHINRVSMMGELAASISHELKQPITATIANADTSLRWLKHNPPDLDEVRELVENIAKDGSRATDIIDRLRSLYKKSPPKREPVEVNAIVREMVVLLRGEASRQGVSVRMDLEENLPKIVADRVQLQQVLMNLMLNAIEAMKETGGVLTVRTQVEGDGRVRISVSDTGVGLPEEKADEIFNAFVTTKEQGSGMGLAISRSIVESHGGKLWATPNEGRGATFHFSLPNAAEGARETAAETTGKG